jgi:hypothetical protein
MERGEREREGGGGEEGRKEGRKEDKFLKISPVIFQSETSLSTMR